MAKHYVRVKDLNNIDWSRTYDYGGARIRNQSDWNQTGEGGRNAPLYYINEPKPKPVAAPKPKAAPRAAPRAAPKPKPKPAPAPTAKVKPPKAPVTKEERAEVTNPDPQGLESTIKTEPSTQADRQAGRPKLAPVGFPTLGGKIGAAAREEVGSFLTRAKKKAGSFLTRNV